MVFNFGDGLWREKKRRARIFARACIYHAPRSFVEMGNYSQLKKGAERNATHQRELCLYTLRERRSELISLGIFFFAGCLSSSTKKT